jgi:hypothetical protein
VSTPSQSAVGATNTTPATTSATTAASPPGLDTINQAANSLGEQLGSWAVVSGASAGAGFYYVAAATAAPGGLGTVTVNVYKYVGSAFEIQATFPLTADGGVGELNPPGSSDDGGVMVVSLTGSAYPDFLVTTDGTTNTIASVISYLNGAWQVVPFATNSGPAIGVPYSNIIGGQILSSANDCNPNCAQGNITEVYYQFSPSTDTFQPASSAAAG